MINILSIYKLSRARPSRHSALLVSLDLKICIRIIPEHQAAGRQIRKQAWKLFGADKAAGLLEFQAQHLELEAQRTSRVTEKGLDGIQTVIRFGVDTNYCRSVN